MTTPDADPSTPPQATTALPRCSVVVPLKDDAAYIAQQLDALAGQTYTGWWEVVIADNGSTDGSPDIARRWNHRLPHLQVIDASDGPGAAHARNVATRHSVGEVVAYCDADDVVSSAWLEALAQASLSHDIVAGRRDDALLNDASLQPATTLYREPHPDLTDFEFLPWAFGGNLAVRREAVDAVGGWNVDYRFGQDVEFCWRLQLHGFTWGYAPDAVVHYRQRETLRALAKQRYRWGKNEARFYADFRNYGLRRRPQRWVRADWIWIVGHVHHLGLGGHRRRSWVEMVSDRVGRIIGSINHRVWCP